MIKNPQLPLPVKLRDQALFSTFHSGPNQELVKSIQHLGEGGERISWLWGEKGCGKSHLLQAACAAVDNSAYIPMADFVAAGAAVLSGYEQYALICLDDIDRVAGAPDWDLALFNLYNSLHTENSGQFLVSSTVAPTQVEVSLNDLRSRLLSGPVYRVQPLADHELIQAILLRADQRGLELPEATAVFLIRHFKRDMLSMCELIDTLDTASLVHKRRVTIPFIRDIIQSDGEPT